MAEESSVPMNILITGAAGFIASHVATRLVLNYPHYKVVALDCMDYCASLSNLSQIIDKPNFKFIKGNIQSADLLNFILTTEEIDTIMHFAAQTHVDNSFGNSLIFTSSNILGTHTMLEAARALSGQIKLFVHVSTDEVYGENLSYDDTTDGNHEMHTALDPTNPYAATKAGAEMLVKAYTRSYGLPTLITRGNNAYGPQQFPEKLIPKMIMMAQRGMKLTVHGDGSNKRSYLYVEDVASAFDLIVHKGTVGRVYNIGTKHEQTVMEVTTSILKHLHPSKDPKTMIDFVQDRPFNDSRYFLDTSALAALGWAQKVFFDEGLKRTIDWYVKNGTDHWKGHNFDNVFVGHPHPSAPSMPSKAPSTKNVIATPPEMPAKRIAPDGDESEAKKAKKSKIKFLIFGRTGWIGGVLGQLVGDAGHEFQFATCRLQEREKVRREISISGATHVLNAAGVTGRPNVDWCESHQVETIRANVIGTLTLVDVASQLGVHVTNFATGCIFHYDDAIGKPENVPRDKNLVCTSGPQAVFTEEDKANFTGSFYSLTKGYVENMLRSYDNVLTLRVRMPIDSDLVNNKRNFIYKIAHYEKVVNIPNSMTVLDELLPYAIELAKRGRTGIFNFTNPGAISHNQVLELYREWIDPDLKWKNFTLEEQAKVITAARSNNELDSSKLWQEFPEMRPIRDSLIEFVFRPSQTEKAKKAQAGA
jgi:UDP-glucose 4,6-dehydratase